MSESCEGVVTLYVVTAVPGEMKPVKAWINNNDKS